MHRFSPALLLVVSILVGQGTLAQVRLGAKAGVNASNVRFDLVDSDPIPGYQAGLIADIGLVSHFSIRPALLVSSKGFRDESDIRDQNGQTRQTIRQTSRLIYAEIPVLLVYEGNLGKSWRWYGGVGPYTGIGITGKIKTDSGILEDQQIKFTSERQSTFLVNAYKRMDYGLNAAAGVERNRVVIGIDYSHGLAGIRPGEGTSIAVETYNRTLALTAGYWFGK